MPGRAKDALRNCIVVAATLLLISCADGTEGAGPSAPSQPGVDLTPVSRLRTGLPEAMVFATADAVLVAGPSGLVSIDPATERKRWRSEVSAYQVTGGFGAVWATDFDDSVVRRLDPASGKVLATVQVEGNPIGIIAGGDSIWTAGHRLGLVSRIDPATNRVVETIRVGPDGPSGAMRMAAQASYVYVDIYSTSTVVQIDTRTGRVTKRIRVHPLTACGRLIPDGAAIWVTGCREDDRVARLDLRTDRVSVSDALGAYADGALMTRGVAWFSAVSADGQVGSLIGVDRRTAKEVARLHIGSATDSSVAAFESLWVVAPGEILRPGELWRFRASELAQLQRRGQVGLDRGKRL